MPTQYNRRIEFRIVKEDSTSRIIFNSRKPETIDAQQKNLLQNEQPMITSG